MKRSKKSVIAIVVVVVVALIAIGLGVWRFYAKPLHDIVPVDESGFTTIYVMLHEAGEENQEPKIFTYELEIPSPDDPDFGNISALLNEMKFRPDFRNLLPWPTQRVYPGKRDINYSAIIWLEWGDTENHRCSLHLLGGGVMATSLEDKEGFLIYHLTDQSLLEQLAEYVKQNGVEK